MDVIARPASGPPGLPGRNAYPERSCAEVGIKRHFPCLQREPRARPTRRTRHPLPDPAEIRVNRATPRPAPSVPPLH